MESGETKRASGWFAVIAVSLGTSLLLLIGHRLINPLPTSAATTALCGVLALWLCRGRLSRWLAGGALAGGLAGALLHVLSHVSEGRMHPDEGLVGHVAGDALIGMLIGAACLAAAVWPLALVRRDVRGSRAN